MHAYLHWVIFYFEVLFFWHILCIHCLNIFKLCIFNFITRHSKYHNMVEPVKDHMGSIVILNDRHIHLMTWIWLAFDDMIVLLWTYCLAKMSAFWEIISYGSDCLTTNVANVLNIYSVVGSSIGSTGIECMWVRKAWIWIPTVLWEVWQGQNFWKPQFPYL